MGKLAHNLQKFPLPANGDIHVDAREKQRQALIAAPPCLLMEVP